MAGSSGSSVLKGLPSFNSSNFSSFQPDSADKRNVKKLSLYISTRDSAPEQVIKKDRSNILLRYLYLQFDKQNNQNLDSSKRKVVNPTSNSPSTSTTTSTTEVTEPSRKVMKRSDSSSSTSKRVTRSKR